MVSFSSGRLKGRLRLPQLMFAWAILQHSESLNRSPLPVERPEGRYSGCKTPEPASILSESLGGYGIRPCFRHRLFGIDHFLVLG